MAPEEGRLWVFAMGSLITTPLVLMIAACEAALIVFGMSLVLLLVVDAATDGKAMDRLIQWSVFVFSTLGLIR